MNPEMVIPLVKGESLTLSGDVIKEEHVPGHTHHKSDPDKKKARKISSRSRKINRRK